LTGLKGQNPFNAGFSEIIIITKGLLYDDILERIFAYVSALSDVKFLQRLFICDIVEVKAIIIGKL
jgi:hypothetical protein